MSNVEVRRPIRTRQAKWAIAFAQALTRARVTPNSISWFSVVCAAGAGACFVLSGTVESLGARVACLFGAAAGIQARLICNLLDGMVAVEGGMKTKSGEVFNDFPDRLADPLILIPAGYATGLAWGADLGWAAGLLAVLTAYVRVLGGSTGVKQDFCGPMAKQHRMAVMTVACVLACGAAFVGRHGWVLAGALGVVVVGAAITVVRRVRRIITALESA